MESGLKRPMGNELCRRLHPNDSRNPFSFTVAPQGVMVWRRGRPKAGIDCPEGAELCRMVKRTYGITGKRSDTDEVNPATMDCAYSRHSILRLWRGPSPRACSAEKNHAARKPNPPFPPTHFCFQTCSGGFAASIYRVMLESSMQVTSHESLVTSRSRLLIPSH